MARTIARTPRLGLDADGVVWELLDVDLDGLEVGHIDDDLAAELPRSLRAELRALRAEWEDHLRRDRREDTWAEWEAIYRGSA